MTELARFLRDTLLHPALRAAAEADLDRALDGYAVTGAERALLAAHDAALLAALGEAVRAADPAPDRPAPVEGPAPMPVGVALPEAALWLRLAPFATATAEPSAPRVSYAVGLAGAGSEPVAPALPGDPLPPIDLEVVVRPSLVDGRVRYAGSLLPRGVPVAAPVRAQAHAPADHPAVRRAAIAAWRAEDRAGAVRRLIAALLDPGPAEGDADPLPAVGRGPHLTICGLGVVVPDHVTREAEAAIRSAQEVLFVNNGPADVAWLRARCPRVTPLLGSAYVDGRDRREGYVEMAVAALVAAMERAPVVFAMSGHPLVAAYAPFLMLDAGRALGLDVRVQPGISALDALLAELEVDPVLAGLQLVEATELLLHARPLQSDVPALIWQVGTVGSLAHDDRVRTADAYAPLRDHLLRFWPADHPVTAVHVSPHPLVRGRRDTVALGDLGALAPVLHAGVSLWVPASAGRPLADPALARRLVEGR